MQGDLSSKAVTIGQSSDSRASGVYNGSSSKCKVSKESANGETPGTWGYAECPKITFRAHSGNMESNKQRQGDCRDGCC
jgi:hypothetical protein